MATHPIVTKLISLLHQEDGRFELNAAGQAQLSQALEAYRGRPQIKDAAEALLLFGFFLQRQKGSPNVALVIIETLQQLKSAVLASSSILEDVLGSTVELDRMIQTLRG